MSGSIEFINPGMVLGGLAVLAPLAIHLLTRLTRRHIRFPSVRFIKAVSANQSALYRFRHLLLLALRVLALTALVLAFMKPVIRRVVDQAKGAPGGPVSAVVVLDASASMGYRVAGGTVFDRGKLAALNVIRDLGSSDKANLILAGLTPRSTLDEPAVGRHLLERELRAAVPTDERSDMDAALAEGVRQLGVAGGARRELHLVSDFQRSTWASVNLKTVPKSVRVVFIPVGEAAGRNVSIDDVTVQPPFPNVGEDVEITCRILNQQAEPAEVPVQLRLGTETLLRQAVSVPAGMSATAGFRVRVTEPGALEGTLSIPDDPLTADNDYYFVVSVADRMNVRVISDEPDLGRRTACPVLLRALDPYGHAASSIIVARRVPSSELVAQSPTLHPVVMLCGVDPLPPAAVDSLLGYVKGGGVLVVFLTSSQDAAVPVQMEKRSGGELTLPFHTGALLDGSGPAGVTTLAQANFEHAVLRKFRDSDDLSKVVFRRRFATDRAARTGQVLARFADGNIAMATQLLGAGVILVCNFSPAPDHSDLARRTLFVPLVHEMIRGLKPGRSGPDRVVVGHPCAASVPGWREDQSIRFTAPDGSFQSATFDVRHEETAVLFPDTTRRGFYRVWVAEQRVASAAVNLDQRESDMAVLNAGQLKDLTRGASAAFDQAQGADADDIGRVRHDLLLWPWCLVAVVLLLLGEQALWMVWRTR